MLSRACSVFQVLYVTWSSLQLLITQLVLTYS